MHYKHNKIIYAVTYGLMYLYARVFFRIRIESAGNIPAKGGAIIAPNHLTYWDPPLIAISTGKFIRFMAKESLFKNPLFGWYIAKLGAFPIKREASDLRAYKMALKILTNGGWLILFPEGARGDGVRLGEAKPGLSRIALSCGVPVVPAVITYEKTPKLFGRNRVRVRFGKPLHYDEKSGKGKEALKEFGEKIMSSIKELDKERVFKQ